MENYACVMKSKAKRHVLKSKKWTIPIRGKWYRAFAPRQDKCILFDPDMTNLNKMEPVIVFLPDDTKPLTDYIESFSIPPKNP